MKVVYITGCLGFIGSYVTRACLQKGWYVKGVDKITYAANEELLWEFNDYENFSFIKSKLFLKSKFKPPTSLNISHWRADNFTSSEIFFSASGVTKAFEQLLISSAIKLFGFGVDSWFSTASVSIAFDHSPFISESCEIPLDRVIQLISAIKLFIVSSSNSSVWSTSIPAASTRSVDNITAPHRKNTDFITENPTADVKLKNKSGGL